MSFENFPYTDFHALNLDWIVKIVKECKEISGETAIGLADLKKYVQDYFSDLNVQAQIDNKLDEMEADGSLAQIINQDIFSGLNTEIANLNSEVDALAAQVKSTSFATVADMQSAASLKSGYAYTAGYYSANDGGAGYYEISDSTTTFAIPLDNGYFATLVSKPDINVKQFGAKGDGSADDTNAIEKSIAYVGASGKVYIPQGKYIIKSVIEINSAITIIGAGKGTSYVHCTESGFLKVNTGNVQIYNLSVYRSPRNDQTANTDIAFLFDGNPTTNTYNITMRDIYINGFGVAIECNYIWSSLFSGITTDYVGIGFKIRGKSVNNTIADCFIQNVSGGSGTHGVYFVGDVANEGWMIHDTLLYGFETGITAQNTCNCMVADCIIDFCTKYGIILNSISSFTGNWKIHDNYISMYGGSAAIYLNNTKSNTQNYGNVVSGNTIIDYKGTANYGVYSTASECKNNTINGNKFKGFSYADIWLPTSDLNNIIHNNICLSTPSGTAFNIVGGGDLAGNIGAVQWQPNVQYVIMIDGRKVAQNTSAPTSGTWKTGDIVINKTPATNNIFGWVYNGSAWKTIALT